MYTHIDMYINVYIYIHVIIIIVIIGLYLFCHTGIDLTGRVCSGTVSLYLFVVFHHLPYTTTEKTHQSMLFCMLSRSPVMSRLDALCLTRYFTIWTDELAVFIEVVFKD
ncbi:Hypothetical predicted protein [Octopus vulgaris]|uniref:Uncharacterized protein n=1 Tax=Octopus vulgaris TaxID=6645 RepID=A0AA36B242_OCTVU|nr:Hypothetical predicted protein [Octopus vulgaris]